MESVTQSQKVGVCSVHNSIMVYNKVIILCRTTSHACGSAGKEQVSDLESLPVVGESKTGSG